jgi:hypothetical protein
MLMSRTRASRLPAPTKRKKDKDKDIAAILRLKEELGEKIKKASEQLKQIAKLKKLLHAKRTEK